MLLLNSVQALKEISVSGECQADKVGHNGLVFRSLNLCFGCSGMMMKIRP